MLIKLQEISKKNKKLAVGLMSGTSLDGIDAALVEIEGCYKDTSVRLLNFITVPYTSEEREAILRLCKKDTSRIDEICTMNVYLGQRMGEAAITVVERYGMSIREIDFVSSHGQTVYHMPEKGSTFQIGELSVIAALTGCVTIGDYRPSDMAYGGQGAPLVPYADYALFSRAEKGRVLLNIGGISNVTVLEAGGSVDNVRAFDTGPGNVLIDAVVRIGTEGRYNFDAGGNIAASGQVNEKWLKNIVLRDSYLKRQPPKSTGREYYTEDFAMELFKEGKSLKLDFPEIVATITAYTAEAIASQFISFIEPCCRIDEVFVGGGGVHNLTLMQEIRNRLDVPVMPMEQLGFSSDAKEAIAFAILGNEFISGRFNNLPGATGAERKVIMGKLALPSTDN